MPRYYWCVFPLARRVLHRSEGACACTRRLRRRCCCQGCLTHVLHLRLRPSQRLLRRLPDTRLGTSHALGCLSACLLAWLAQPGSLTPGLALPFFCLTHRRPCGSSTTRGSSTRCVSCAARGFHSALNSHGSPPPPPCCTVQRAQLLPAVPGQPAGGTARRRRAWHDAGLPGRPVPAL
jgi:hypothetical protein